MDEVVVEREGYLHGVKIIGSDEESDSGEDTDRGPEIKKTKPGVCPFTGVQAGMGELEVAGSPPRTPSSKAEPASPSRIPVMRAEPGVPKAE